MRNGKLEFIVQLNVELLEARGGDMMNNHFHVSTRTFELKPAKARKCDACRDWRIQEPPILVFGNKDRKGVDQERLQLGHVRKTLEQNIWLEING